MFCNRLIEKCNADAYSAAWLILSAELACGLRALAENILFIKEALANWPRSAESSPIFMKRIS